MVSLRACGLWACLLIGVTAVAAPASAAGSEETIKAFAAWQGRGQIFATSQDGIDAYDPLVKGQELGTYYATMQFITAGQWAVAIRFQRDSTRKLERMDWMQEVFPARGEAK